MQKVLANYTSSLFDDWIEVKDLSFGFLVIDEVILVIYFDIFIFESFIKVIRVQIELLQAVNVPLNEIFLFLNC